ncbi:glutathione S-transferase [Oceaniovalibus guishaninsula]|nr:glutathione S-transferase [Oceaniovalibus guishaninsula]
MELFQNPASPFARKVRVLLHETGQQDAVRVVTITANPVAGSSASAVNPLGKIPVLVRPEGPALYDSRVICRYLDDRAAKTLYPPSRLYDVLTLEATADGIMEAAVLMVYEGRVRPAEKQFGDWVEAQWSKIARALDAVEARWLSHLGGPLDMGQVALGCALGYLDFRHADRDWRQERPGLAAWDARFAARPAMAATRPDA